MIAQIHFAGRGADAAFETEATHSGAAADIALGDGTCLRGLYSSDGGLGLNMKALDVVQFSVPGFGDNRIGRVAGASLAPLLNAGVYLPDCIGIGDADRSFDDAEILQVGLSGHLAIAV